MKKQAGDREVILEFHRIGDYVKVSVMDAETLTETSIVGAASASQAELERLALKKLEYVLKKKQRSGSDS
jgi:hypothetical protein